MTPETKTTQVKVVAGCLTCEHYIDAGVPGTQSHSADATCNFPGRPRAPWGTYALPWSGYLKHLAKMGEPRPPPDWCPLPKLGDTVEVRAK